MNFTEYFDWKILLFVSVVTSLITEAVKTFTPSWLNGNKTLPAVALLITILRIPFEGANFAEWQNLILNILFTMCFAVLFYNYLGQWTVTKLFGWIKGRLKTVLPEEKPDA